MRVVLDAYNIYPACAVEGWADYLVSGNLNYSHEVGNPFRGVQILTPRELLDILDRLDE